MPIHYELDDEHILLITIDRPEARNSADMEHFKLLREAWDNFNADPGAWVAIITGVEDTFFVGADLKKYVPEITKYQKQIAAEGLAEIDGYRLDDGTKAVLRGAKIWKPIIAAVNGFCAAGGMEMLGGVDIRVACPEAKFAVMEPKRGLFAGGGTTVRLPRQIPFPLAMEFLLCADLIDAQRAYEMAVARGAHGLAEPELLEDETGKVVTSAIATYGETRHTFVERAAYSGVYLP
jgi:enoyl-CoA hydratase